MFVPITVIREGTSVRLRTVLVAVTTTSLMAIVSDSMERGVSCPEAGKKSPRNSAAHDSFTGCFIFFYSVYVLSVTNYHKSITAGVKKFSSGLFAHNKLSVFHAFNSD
jgi:hypothetical protein